MYKLTKKAIRDGRPDERTDPNYRKASLLKILNLPSSYVNFFYRLGCQIIITKELEGIRLRLPRATKNFYVDGHVPQPH